MKMVINANYGGFGFDVAEQYEDWVRDLGGVTASMLN